MNIKKILSIGIPLEYDNVTNVQNIEEMDSLFNFELVLINPRCFLPFEGVKDWENTEFSDEAVKKWESTISKIQAEAALLLESGGSIISLFKPKSTISSKHYYDGKFYKKIISNYDWVPLRQTYRSFHNNIVKGRGSELSIKNQSDFSAYLQMKETRWEAQFNEIKNLELIPHVFRNYSFNEKIKPEMKVLAVNKADLVVAVEMKIGKGKIIFLPLSNHEKFASIIIDNINKLPKRIVKEAPQWISEYKFTDEEKLKNSIQLSENKLNDLSKKVQQLKNEHTKKSSIKRLLYEQGDELEDAVKEAFEEIGFEMIKKDDKDWFAKIDNRSAIIEVTGHEKDIDIKKLRQLINYKLEEEKITGENKHAIMVGNHFINQNPQDRGPAYTEKAIQQASILSITLINTYDLFKIISKIRQGEIEKKTVRENMLKSNGLYAFEDC